MLECGVMAVTKRSNVARVIGAVLTHAGRRMG